MPNSLNGAVSNTGYKVTCAAGGGSGVFEACDDTTCGRCNPPTPFTTGQCVPNPPEFGSRSVIFNCGAGSGGGGGGVSPVTGGGNVTAPAPAGSGSGAASVAVSITAAGVAVAAAARAA